jgi:hypothetical protein
VIVIAALMVFCCAIRLQACTHALCIDIMSTGPGLISRVCSMNRNQLAISTDQSISTPMHCFLFLVHSSPPDDIDVKRLLSTSPTSSPVRRLVDLPISSTPRVARGRTFFFSSTEIPPGPTLTSSKRPPTIAIHQFRFHRSLSDITYREFGNYNISFSLIRSEYGSLQVVFEEISLRMSRVNTPPIYQYQSAEKGGTYQLLMNTLNTLKRVTRKLALHLALNPTATMIQAPNPTMETTTLAKDHFPWKMNPIKRKINRIRPANWKLCISILCRRGRGDVLLPPIGFT